MPNARKQTARRTRTRRDPGHRTTRGARASVMASALRGASRAGPRKNVRRGGAASPAAPVVEAPASPAERRRARVEQRKAGKKAGLVTEALRRRKDVGRRALRIGMKVGFGVGLAYAVLLAVQGVHDYATTSPRFEVSSLIFEETRHVDDDRLRELLALEKGTNILALDLEALSARVAAEPWVERAEVIRQLPDTLEVQLTEHREAAVVLAGHFYLANDHGQLFKQVERGERGELPIITGIDRADLLASRQEAEARVLQALEVLEAYRAKQRPRLSEVHLGAHGDVTLFTAEAGTQIRLGRGDVTSRLERLDALRAALGDKADRLAVVHLDHEVDGNRSERVVASFFDPHDEASLLAAAMPEPEPEPASGAGATSKGPRKRLIPRAY